MKKMLFVLALLSITFFSFAQESKKPKKKAQVVEAACGSCKFHMEGKGCELAVKVDGKPYYVEGAKMEDYGDAHAKDGMCNAVRKAKVKGEVKDGKYVVSSFKLLPMNAEKK